MFAVSALLGLIAKEDVIASFGTLAACLATAFIGTTEDGIYEVTLMIQQTGIGIPALVSFIAFNMLTVPCFAAVAAARGEIGKGKFKWTLLFWIVVSYLVSTIVYTVGEWAWTLAIWGVLAAVAVAAIAAYNKAMDKKERAKKALKK